MSLFLTHILKQQGGFCVRAIISRKCTILNMYGYYLVGLRTAGGRRKKMMTSKTLTGALARWKN